MGGCELGEDTADFAVLEKMRGSLHCATDDETVRRFGRDYDYLGQILSWYRGRKNKQGLKAARAMGDFDFFGVLRLRLARSAAPNSAQNDGLF